MEEAFPSTFREYRAVLHTTDHDSHIDFFIMEEDSDFLLTYEIESSELESSGENIFRQKQKNYFPNLKSSVVRPKEFSIKAKKKSNHRKLYWTFEGDISNYRGSIVEIAKGTLIGSVGSGVIFLSVEAK